MRVLSNVVDQPLDSNLVGRLSASRCRRLTKEERTCEPLKSICRYQAARAQFFGPQIGGVCPPPPVDAAPPVPSEKAVEAGSGSIPVFALVCALETVTLIS